MSNGGYKSKLVTSSLSLAWQDLWEGVKHWRVWTLLSWQDIRLRYRRSQLGPFWLTLSMAITIYVMGFLYGHLFRAKLNTYFPYLAAGMLAWNLFSILVIETTHAFIGAEHYIKQIKLPYSVYVLRMIARCFIIFAHNIVVIVPLYFIFHIPVNSNMWWMIPAMMLIFINAFTFGTIFALLGARFRDFALLVPTIIQILFFVTPIMWDPAILPPEYQIWVALNPVAQFIELLRAPILGIAPSSYTLCIVMLATVISMYVSLTLLAKVRSRIIYWL